MVSVLIFNLNLLFEFLILTLNFNFIKSLYSKSTLHLSHTITPYHKGVIKPLGFVASICKNIIHVFLYHSSSRVCLQGHHKPCHHLVCLSVQVGAIMFFIKPLGIPRTCHVHQGLHQGFQVFIKSIMTTSSSSRVQGPTKHQVWVKGLLWSFFIKQGASQASSTASAIPGDLQESRSIMTSPVGLVGLLLGYHNIIKA